MDTHVAAPASHLRAGGTRHVPATVAQPNLGRRVRLIIELGILFIAAPLALKTAVFTLHLPLFILLPPVLLLVLIYLLWDGSFRVLSEFSKGVSPFELVSIVALFAVLGAILAGVVAYQLPNRFLDLPRERPHIWQKIMLFYPLLSVIPQELIYRSFYFHRYGALFGNAKWLAILSNGILFGFSHIMFGSYTAVALSTGLGILLAWRYIRTRSFLAVWLEHSLYGCLVFTVGIGYLFFTGVAGIR